MTTIELFVIRTFLIWNITIHAGTVFEISSNLANELIQRNVCITMEERKKRLVEKEKKKAEQEAAKLKAEPKEELPQPKKGRKPKDPEASQELA